MKACDHPAFVEDVVRRVAHDLKGLPGVHRSFVEASEPCLECREANRLHNEQTRQRLLASPRKDVELACGTPKGVYRHRARGVRDRCGVSPKKAGTR